MPINSGEDVTPLRFKCRGLPQTAAHAPALGLCFAVGARTTSPTRVASTGGHAAVDGAAAVARVPLTVWMAPVQARRRPPCSCETARRTNARRGPNFK